MTLNEKIGAARTLIKEFNKDSSTHGELLRLYGVLDLMLEVIDEEVHTNSAKTQGG